MKSIASMITVLMIGMLMLVIVMTSAGRSSREMELSQILPSAVEEAVRKIMKENTYEITDREEWIADFAQELSQTLDNDCDLMIEIAGADLEKGLLSVRTTAKYEHPNGKNAQVSCERTVLLEKQDLPKQKQYNICFYADGKCYKKYTVAENEKIIAPITPVKEGNSFFGWIDENGYLADFSQPITQNLVFYAEWS